MGSSNDIAIEARRVLAAASEADVALNLLGGVAIYVSCSSSRKPPLSRDYKDLDFVARSNDRFSVREIFRRTGYVEDEQFNRYHGHRQMLFYSEQSGRRVDVFMDRLRMCHELDLTHRIQHRQPTLPLADLLLTKLQVVQMSESDLRDSVTLLADHSIKPEGIDAARVSGVLADDWGWWRTATGSLNRVEAFALELRSFLDIEAFVGKLEELRTSIDSANKSIRWKARARLGDRVKWYSTPEEGDGQR